MTSQSHDSYSSDKACLPPVSRRGNVLFVGSVFSSAPYGSHVVMRELLRNFDKNSFWIVSTSYANWISDYEFEGRTLRLNICGGMLSKMPYSGLIRAVFKVWSVVKWARARCVASVVAVYPSLDFLPLAIIVAHRLKVPCFLYMHDTMCEALIKSKMIFFIERLQSWAFSSARRVMVMSEGMAELYRKKYNLDCVSAPHPYCEQITESESTHASRSLFWGGGIYGINDKSLIRVITAATSMNVVVRISACSEAVRNRIVKWRESGLLVEPVYYAKRKDYLAALRNEGALVLALNRPEESGFGKDELATIFSTKVPEYLASGRPVVVFCPDDYYLSRFFVTHECGIVVNSIDQDAIMFGIREALSEGDRISKMCRNALNQARSFESSKVAENFSRVIDG